MSKRSIVSCGIVPVREIDGKYHYLVLGWNGYYDFPKGRMEEGETHLQTAIRETAEEAGISYPEMNFKWGEVSKNSDKYRRGTKHVVYFLAQVQDADIYLPINEELGRPEHDDFVWATYKEASELLKTRVQKILDWAHNIVETKNVGD